MNELTIDKEAEELVRGVAAALTAPRRDGECLLCFVARMLDDFGCDTTLRFAKRYRDLRATRATALEARLARMGGFCDCEIFMNGMTLAEHQLERDETGEARAPERLPICVGVRRGQPGGVRTGCVRGGPARGRRHSVYYVCMARLNVYVPDDLAAAARGEGLNVSALTQDAIGAALAARATDRWLDSLGPGEQEFDRADVLAALDAARDELGA